MLHDHLGQLAAPLRRGDDRRPDGDGRARPAGGRDAVHADGRDDAGHARGGARAAERRGARRDRARRSSSAPARPSSTAPSRRTSTCAAARPPSARRRTRAPRSPPASSPAATASPTARATPAPATRVDAQAAYESQMSIWSSVLGGAHLVYHGAGWMEGGLTASFEKIVLDVEMLQMMALTIAPVGRRRGRGPARASTRSPRCRPAATSSARRTRSRATRRAFYEPLVSDWQNYESWEEAGAQARRGARDGRLAGGARAVRAAAARRGDRGAPGRVRGAAPGRARAGGGDLTCASSTSSASTTAASRRSASTPTRPTARGSPRSRAASLEMARLRGADRLDADALVLSGSTDPWACARSGRARAASRTAACGSTGPVLGICAGMQNLVRALGGTIGPAARRADGFASVDVVDDSDLLASCCGPSFDVRKRHDDEVKQLPTDFRLLATSATCRVEAIAARDRPWWGTQFHPEAWDDDHPVGRIVLERFLELAGSPVVNHGTAALARGLAVLEALADADDGCDGLGVVAAERARRRRQEPALAHAADARGTRLRRARPGDARLSARLARVRPAPPEPPTGACSTPRGRCCASS